MDILFLGYQIIDFTNTNGEVIKGLKLHFAHQGDSSSFIGMKTEVYFVDAFRDKILYDMVQKCSTGKTYNALLSPSFSGKSKILSLKEI